MRGASAGRLLRGIVDAPTQVTSAEPIEIKGDLPAYCEVKGYIAPAVEIHVALPSSWNGKLIELGSVGEINDEACDSVLRKGYACDDIRHGDENRPVVLQQSPSQDR